MPTDDKSRYTYNDYLVDSNLAEEAVECRRNGYVLTGKFLGQGAYAKVYLGQAVPEKIQDNFKLRRMNTHGKDVKVAIKIISTSSAPEIYITKFLPREVSTMNRCYMHSNVIQLYDIFASRKRIYLVLEYAECGDLLSYVNHCYAKKADSNCLTEDKARLMFRDILAGVHFIHSRGVAHRDLKCENILLAKNKQAKLSDFGFAIQPSHSRELLKTHCGSYAYAPPEILKQQKYDGKLADLWSLGVILFAMVNGGLPFKESDAKAVLGAMKKPVYFKGYLTADCKDLIRGLLKIRPQKRLSLPEIYAHSWMKKCCLVHSKDRKAVGDESVISAGDFTVELPSPVDELQPVGNFDTPESVYNYIKERMGQEVKCRKSSVARTLITEITSPKENHEQQSVTESSLPVSPPTKLPLPNSNGAKEKKEDSSILPKPQPTVMQSRKNLYSSSPSSLKSTPVNPKISNPPKVIKPEFMLVKGGSANMALPRVANSPDPGTKQSKAQESEKTWKEVKAFTKPEFRTAPPNVRYDLALPSSPLTENHYQSHSRQANKLRRQKTGRKTVDFLRSQNRSLTSPNVININIETNKVRRSKETYLKMPQRPSILNSHLPVGVARPGASSVPPKTIEPSGHANVLPPKLDTQGSEIVIKFPAKGNDEEVCDRAKYNLTCSHNYKKNPGANVVKKMLSVIPEKERQTGKRNHKTETSSPYHRSAFKYIRAVGKMKQNVQSESKKYSTPTLTQHQHPSNTNKTHGSGSIYHNSNKPSCAVAAWVGQHCVAATSMKTTHSDTKRHHRPTTLYYRIKEKYNGNSKEVSVESNGRQSGEPGTGKLLYKRAQTNKNILESINQSINYQTNSINIRNTKTHHYTTKTGTKSPAVLRFSHLR